jgi:hypothetical protein
MEAPGGAVEGGFGVLAVTPSDPVDESLVVGGALNGVGS